ncbi:hypothetical protein HOLleu_44070 [Holothuria leucospilota]|uniref:Uncharacterized protein n=1 Tax=Holothuria leucospilota TaxID=206669 RepID=A0A9Q0YAX4_HOLLE|nr:hypothetical protein HOLleu_44070 [Holothuria leucospilota]
MQALCWISEIRRCPHHGRYWKYRIEYMELHVNREHVYIGQQVRPQSLAVTDVEGSNITAGILVAFNLEDTLEYVPPYSILPKSSVLMDRNWMQGSYTTAWKPRN